MRKLALVVLLLGCGSAVASTIFEDDEWAAGEFSDDWTSTISGEHGDRSPNLGQSYADSSGFGLGNGGGGDYLRITAGDPLLGGPEDFIFADSGSELTGNLAGSNIRSVRFRFLNDANADPDNSLSLYFYSSTAGRTWYYPITGASAGTWSSHIVNLSLEPAIPGTGDWDNLEAPGAGTQGEFTTSLGDVDEIGILLTYHTLASPTQVYGLDNFALDNQFFIPEPGSLAMLGVALGSLGVMFRRNRKDEEDEAGTI